MARIHIECPECSTRLSFEEVWGYENMLVECPRCRYKANVRKFRRYDQGVENRGYLGTDYYSPATERAEIDNRMSEPTQLLMPPTGAADAGRFRVVSTGEIQWLRPGTNIIGRRAKTGTADIKISNDPYMSRRHARIDVIAHGGEYIYRLVEINSTNIIKLNGEPINRGEVLTLRFGDRLTLGKTDIVIESNAEESTRINEESSEQLTRTRIMRNPYK